MAESQRFHLFIVSYVFDEIFVLKVMFCAFVEGNTTDIFFAPLKTRFIRVFITDNHGGDHIFIQGIGFYGVDMRLVNLLREHGLERSLQTLLANVRSDCMKEL